MPFGPGEFRNSVGTNAISLDRRLGEEYERRDGSTLRLVKLDGTAFAAQKRTFKWVDDATNVVTPTTATGERVAGVGDALLTTDVPISGYFLMVVGGRAVVRGGDDFGANPVVNGEYLQSDNDGDTGKVRGAGATFGDPSIFFARARETQTLDDQDLDIDIMIKLPLRGARPTSW